jgi:FkbM family methyltransferase
MTFVKNIWKKLLIARRSLLMTIVPEFFWPKYIRLDNSYIPVRNSPLSFGNRWLIRKGGYEAEERALSRQLVQPGWQVLEMGASAGIVTATLADAVGPQGRVLAIEAAPELAAFSSRWLARYPWVSVEQGFAFPVWTAPAIQLNGFDQTKGSLGGRLHFEVGHQAVNSNQSAAPFDMERIYRQHQLSPRLLVVDIEGSESILLQAAPAFPSTLQHIVIELHPGLYPSGKADEAAIIAVIQAEGFALKQRLADVCWFGRD